MNQPQDTKGSDEHEHIFRNGVDIICSYIVCECGHEKYDTQPTADTSELTLDEAIAQFADYARGEGGFDELDLKEVIQTNREQSVREALESLRGDDFFKQCQGCSCDAVEVIDKRLAELQG